MNKVRIVTDSTALFIDPTIVKRYEVTVVPVRLQMGDTTYRLGYDIGAEDFLRHIQREDVIPKLIPPTPEDFLEIYKRLNRDVNQIISLHLSARLGHVCHNAKIASQMLLGRCDIEVVDSQTISAGLGMLVDKTGQIASEADDLEDIVRLVRRTIPRIYAVFYVEKMNMIREQGFIGAAQTILGTMLGIMPFLTIEEGQLMIMEKARTHAQAIEKLAEFAMEFASIDQMALLTHTNSLTEPIRLLQDRLALELQGQDFPTMLYDPSIGSLLGADATGLVILEGEEEDIIA